ncbi:MAG TPA: tripartite tricarboxylate transporter substrate binding protein [Xanthobacteraceae bacterium]|jgi:tripartite-type tricarboxylate transporter receptor subunit TctC|nr:tripartite tricarboxylate transporter substrate binding protein [Xanthobacteraceae bacterium]
MLTHKLKIAGIACALSMLASSFAAAQEWPTKPITLVVPFAAGGTTDLVGRPLAQSLATRLGQSVIVDNRAGAGGTIGAGLAAKSAPDGYTMFLATIAHTIAPGIYKNLPYDFVKDFDPITVVGKVPNVLIVNPAVPARTPADLISYIKANPGKVNFGSAGAGSVEHLSGELFRSMAGVDIVHVPYKGGAPMMTDLIAGHIQMAIETSGSALQHIKAGAVRALAVSTREPSPFFPGLPTLDEAGLKGYDVTTWYGLLVPRTTPAPVRTRLYQTVSEILKTPDMVARLADLGAVPDGEPPEQFAAFIQAETAKWTKVTRDAGVTAE